MMAAIEGDKVEGIPFRRPRILLVDDHELGRKSLARLLDVHGYDVLAAEDGQAAIRALRPDSSFDYILTDLRLPDLDGREVISVAQRLVTVPWIALITGWDFDCDELARLGVNWIFLKPLDVHSIVAKLQEFPPRS